MYVACKELKTKSGVVRLGEIVEDAPSWRYPVILAHVNMGWIRWVDDSGYKAPPKTAAPPKTEPAQLFACDQCDRKDFKSPKAVKTHVALKHKAG